MRSHLTNKSAQTTAFSHIQIDKRNIAKLLGGIGAHVLTQYFAPPNGVISTGQPTAVSTSDRTGKLCSISELCITSFYYLFSVDTLNQNNTITQIKTKQAHVMFKVNS